VAGEYEDMLRTNYRKDNENKPPKDNSTESTGSEDIFKDETMRSKSMGSLSGFKNQSKINKSKTSKGVN